MESSVYKIVEALTFVIGIGMDAAVRIASPTPSISIQASLALTVFKDYYFTGEAVGMVQNSLDQATDKIGVCGSAILPLGVHLDQDDIVWFDHSRSTTQSGLMGRTVEFQPLVSQKTEKSVNASVVVSVPVAIKGLVRNIFHPENRTAGISCCPGCMMKRMKHWEKEPGNSTFEKPSPADLSHRRE